MDQTARVMGSVQPLEGVRGRAPSGPLAITLQVSDPDIAAELRRHPEGDERDRFTLAALRVGVLALRTASGQVDAVAIREAGMSLVSEVRELLSSRATEMTERLASTMTHYLDPQSGALPQRIQALVRQDGELERLLRSHVGANDSVLARSLAGHLGEGSPIFKMLSPTDEGGLRSQLTRSIEAALTEQRTHILREFSLDQKDSALSRLFAEFSLDDDASALARLKRELLSTIDALTTKNVEFQAQVREALARLDTRKKEEARSTKHGFVFEEQLGAVLVEEARRLGDLYEATGETTGAIKQCKKGDYVVELGRDSAAAHARIVWEAKEKHSYSLRAALEEIDEARRNRQAQVGVFVFSRKTAPEGLEALQRQGNDIILVWDADDPASELVVRAAYSLARALVVREVRSDRESQAAIAEVERAARGVERQIGHLEDVRKWAETVKGHGEKIVDRSSRMADELRRDVERLDAQIAAMRTAP